MSASCESSTVPARSKPISAHTLEQLSSVIVGTAVPFGQEGFLPPGLRPLTYAAQNGRMRGPLDPPSVLQSSTIGQITLVFGHLSLWVDIIVVLLMQGSFVVLPTPVWLLINRVRPCRAASLASARCFGDAMLTTPAGSVAGKSNKPEANFFRRMLLTARSSVAFFSSPLSISWLVYVTSACGCSDARVSQLGSM